MAWTRRGVTWIVFLAGLAASILLTVLFWPNFFGLLLLLPFVFTFPFARGRSRVARSCPRCGWTETNPEARFCPRDATPLDPA